MLDALMDAGVKDVKMSTARKKVLLPHRTPFFVYAMKSELDAEFIFYVHCFA